MNIVQACHDQNLFAPFLGDDLSTWSGWFVVLRALFGLEMSADELKTFTRLTGRAKAPTEPATEGWFCVGRRSGKSRITAVIAAYLSVFVDYSRHLAPGEPGIVMVLSQNRRQAQVVFRYLKSIFESTPMLRKMVITLGKETIELTNGIRIEVHTSNFRSVRGHTVVAGICDEIAYWFTEDSSNPDVEVVGALRPAMSTIPSALLLGLSSPYRRAGVMFDSHRQFYGKESDVLVIQAASRDLNPTLDPRLIQRAMERDAESARAEWLGQFRSDISAFVDPTMLDAVIPSGLKRRGFIKGQSYKAFVDPAGGSGGDSFSLAIGHVEEDRPVLDIIEEKKPPFSPAQTIGEFSELLKQYGVHSVTGDRFGGEFPRELFRKNGISYHVSKLDRSKLYIELLPLINSSNCSLLDHPKLIAQLCALERRTGNSGRDSIDHPKNFHDDLSNTCAGVMSLLIQRHTEKIINLLDGRELTPGDFEWARLNAPGGIYN